MFFTYSSWFWNDWLSQFSDTMDQLPTKKDCKEFQGYLDDKIYLSLCYIFAQLTWKPLDCCSGVGDSAIKVYCYKGSLPKLKW